MARPRVSFAPGKTIDDAVKSGRSRIGWTATSTSTAFQDSLDQWGDTGRNILRGPSQMQLDLTLARTLALTARQRLEVRWEIYNALNTPVFANPASTFAANGYGTAGQITSTIGGPAHDAAGGALPVLGGHHAAHNATHRIVGALGSCLAARHS